MSHRTPLGAYKPRILKEGFVEKKSRVLKKWRKRYFKLNGEVLCFFKQEDLTSKTRPMGRIFLADVLAVGKYFSKAKNKDNCFSIDTKSGKKHIMNCETKEERDAWILIVNFAKDDFLKQEESDPVRRRSFRLKGDMKRIKLFKDPTKGIGVRIKSVNGCVFVTRIVEDGPVAETGVLTPGDQILDVDGVDVGNMTIEQVSEVLKAAPILMTCTVKPANHFLYCGGEKQTAKSSYAEIDIDALAATAAAKDVDDEKIDAGYEDDRSSTGSGGYVIMPSDEEIDDELENGEDDSQHIYDKPEVDDSNAMETGETEYVNVPPESGDGANTPELKQKAPAAQRNYLELYFES